MLSPVPLWFTFYSHTPQTHEKNSQVFSISVGNTFSISCLTSLERVSATISKPKKRKTMISSCHKDFLPLCNSLQGQGAKVQVMSSYVHFSVISVNVFHSWSSLMSDSFTFITLLSKQFISKIHNALLSTLATFQKFDKCFLIYF